MRRVRWLVRRNHERRVELVRQVLHTDLRLEADEEILAALEVLLTDPLEAKVQLVTAQSSVHVASSQLLKLNKLELESRLTSSYGHPQLLLQLTPACP